MLLKKIRFLFENPYFLGDHLFIESTITLYTFSKHCGKPESEIDQREHANKNHACVEFLIYFKKSTNQLKIVYKVINEDNVVKRLIKIKNFLNNYQSVIFFSNEYNNSTMKLRNKKYLIFKINILVV